MSILLEDWNSVEQTSHYIYISIQTEPDDLWACAQRSLVATPPLRTQARLARCKGIKEVTRGDAMQLQTCFLVAFWQFTEAYAPLRSVLSLHKGLERLHSKRISPLPELQDQRNVHAPGQSEAKAVEAETWKVLEQRCS
jgi:hypothetical protein